jgi:hypothetical protein
MSFCRGSSARCSLHAFGGNTAPWPKSTPVHSAAALRRAGKVRVYGSVGTTRNQEKHESLVRLSSSAPQHRKRVRGSRTLQVARRTSIASERDVRSFGIRHVGPGIARDL